MKFGQLILRRIVTIVATKCQILRLKCTKIQVLIQNNTQTNRVRTQQHRNGRPTNMEVASLLLGCQKYEIPAELMSIMFSFHSVPIPINAIIPYILRQVHAAIIRTTSKAQLAAHLRLYKTNRSNIVEPPSSWSSLWRITGDRGSPTVVSSAPRCRPPLLFP